MKTLSFFLFTSLLTLSCRTSQSSLESSTPQSSQYRLIKDQEFDSTWKESIVPFIKSGERRYFEGQDKLKLEYFTFTPPNAKADIVVVHGFTQNYRSFAEFLYTLTQNGYAVHAYSHIGHGCSEHLLMTKEQNIKNLASNCEGLSQIKDGKTYYADSRYGRVHVDTYYRYINDLKTFVDRVKNPARPTYLFCHSMGGGVCSRTLQEHPTLVNAAYLHAPMLRNKNNLPYWILTTAGKVSAQLAPEEFGPQQSEVSMEEVTFEAAADHGSRNRFDYSLELISIQNGLFRNGASSSQVNQLLQLTVDVVKPENLAKVVVPVYIAAAGEKLDRWVELKGVETFCKGVSNCKYKSYEAAKHEIYSEPDAIRIPLFESVLDYFADPASYLKSH